MKRLLAVVGVVALASGLSAQEQTLAGAAKKADEAHAAAAKTSDDKAAKPAAKTAFTDKDLKDVSPLYPSAVTASPSTGITTASVAPIEQTEDERATAYRTTAKKDEAYWKDRMRTLHATLDGNQAFLAAAIMRESALDKRLHRSVDDMLYIRDRLLRATVDHDWQEAVAEVSRLKAAVQNDTKLIADAELEAHRAGVPPGWLVLP